MWCSTRWEWGIVWRGKYMAYVSYLPMNCTRNLECPVGRFHSLTAFSWAALLGLLMLQNSLNLPSNMVCMLAFPVFHLPLLQCTVLHYSLCNGIIVSTQSSRTRGCFLSVTLQWALLLTHSFEAIVCDCFSFELISLCPRDQKQLMLKWPLNKWCVSCWVSWGCLQRRWCVPAAANSTALPGV